MTNATIDSLKRLHAEVGRGDIASATTIVDARETSVHDARVEQLIAEFTARVRRREAELAKKLNGRPASFLSQPHHAPQQHLQQLQAIISACKTAAATPPRTDYYVTPIPALLALQRTHRLISETRMSLQRSRSELAETSERLTATKKALKESKELGNALEARVLHLRQRRDAESQRSDEDRGRELLKAGQRKRTFFDKDTRRLVEAMNIFIEDRLAGMLAAEELGGPVVGGLTNITDDDLELGFSAQGRRKKLRSGAERPSHGLRQKRIDEIWGRAEDVMADGEDEEGERTERNLAADEVRALLEDMLNTSIGSVEAGGGSGSYIELKRDSAAARFLVRAKVAQFHPRDARRIRLIDFGRELEDG